mgnify:CR=1 FL=1
MLNLKSRFERVGFLSFGGRLMESHDERVVEVLEDMKSELEYINSAMAGKDKLSPFEKNKLELKFNSIKEKLDVAKKIDELNVAFMCSLRIRGVDISDNQPGTAAIKIEHGALLRRPRFN